QTHRAAVVDPVLDYDQRTGKASAKSADRIIDRATVLGAAIDWVLETHVHADHLSGAPYIKVKTGARVVIGERIREVQKIFRPVFNALDVSGEGSEFDRLVKDGDRLPLGDLTIEVIATPGHTPACVSYRIGDMVFVGDTLFMPDYGTARADFPGGDARALYRSIRRLLALPKETRLFMCHDYLPKGGRDHYAWETTVGDELAHNIHVHEGVSEDQFVAMRQARDATLSAPVLLMPSIQVNMRAGKLPPADANGVHYIKIPVSLAS
ncbi:MAG: MBL fold metallo-hydrolase, partial [Aestuariivirga sp.]